MTIRYLWYHKLVYPITRNIKYIKATFFEKDPKRKRPKIGEMIRACCPDDQNPKEVAYVSMHEDIIEYIDGSSDSYFHCGWERIV